MRKQVTGSLVAVALAAAAVGAGIALSVTGLSGQATRPARVGGKPNFSGIWQANNEAYWDLEAHEARAGMVTQQGVYPYDYARVPAAPGFTSIRTCWPKVLPVTSPSMRMCTSVTPPAANGL